MNDYIGKFSNIESPSKLAAQVIAQNIAKLFFERLDVNKSNEFLDRINLILKS